MQKNKSKIFLTSISASLLSTIISIAVTIFSIKSDSVLVQLIYIILLIVLSMILVAIYLYLAGIDYKDNREQLIKTKKDLEYLSALPRTIIFKKRKDIFTIYDNGDAKLEWNFQIEKKTDNNIEFINFPVICERRDNNISMEFASVEIKEVIVNGKKLNNATYELKSLNSSKENTRTVEIGSIHVPLYLSKEDKDTIDITISLNFKDIFFEYERGEFVVVDVTYITKEIELLVVPESPNKRIEVVDNFFNAHEVNGNNADLVEQTEQAQKCSTDGNKLRWHTEYPKLGYRYEVSFKIINKI